MFIFHPYFTVVSQFAVWKLDTDLLSLCLRLLPDGVEVFEQIWPHLLLVT